MEKNLLDNESNTASNQQDDASESARNSNKVSDDEKSVRLQIDEPSPDESIDNKDGAQCENEDDDSNFAEEQEIEHKSIVSVINSDLNFDTSQTINGFFTKHNKKGDNNICKTQGMEKCDIHVTNTFEIMSNYVKMFKNLTLNNDTNVYEIIKSKIEAKCKKRNP